MASIKSTNKSIFGADTLANRNDSIDTFVETHTSLSTFDKEIESHVIRNV